ncbi:hypothetical protein HanRHA438_Chr00c22g0852861 [Helianthus annuus]|uniref:Uncharacterized protein n=1 Tax=Helianthus annuus TaxID=4232 RepID=A0A9K3P138_HELAN|nr:hypothetical protein HanXRQr2_Chr02g0085641 [Helianthus annuus]KAJ0606210.1 hypothetical protein HanHA300_Chr02g0071481 [Helianthus annuus]KAJ0617210.1 hypothetical protein HanIR_Chr02g0098911 [Helianthus annuus]KAJ0620234.1 hypothetical protein HanHA89_Chr02g0080021 [Helianthus annuus]KAJ0778685.1 hypothetical protein HanLR1_Chr02g0074341 [Helianthus annuus]
MKEKRAYIALYYEQELETSKTSSSVEKSFELPGHYHWSTMLIFLRINPNSLSNNQSRFIFH